MASQRDIRRRINSSKNIKQITRAMQFVAASKLKRAQDATLSARPYAEKLDEVLADLAIVLGGEEHPLLVEFAKKRVVPIYGLNYKDQRQDANAWLARFGNPYVTYMQAVKRWIPGLF